ncbi:MAG: gliding motility protein GldN [Bacteroidota bacterium]|nr:gliding motility protein GldN [Bacteroidota bacterium]
MKRILFGIVTLAGFSFSAAAQQQPVVNEHDEYNYQKLGVKERVAVPYPSIREADVIFEKRVYRVIDTREKKNLVMQWPKNPLNKIIYDLTTIDDGGFTRLKAYRNDSLSSAYTADDVRKMGAIEETVFVGTDPNDPSLGYDSLVSTPFDYTTIKRFLIYEQWIFDKQRGMLFPRIIAIAPVYNPMINGVELPEQPMFWISWNEIRPLLVNEEVFNRQNDAMRLTYYDFFELRLFSSYITRESNEFDYAIKDFPEYKDSPMDALYESERIKGDIFTWEHDLWQY